MALLHHTDLRPSKLELIEGWAPSQPWFSAGAAAGFSTVAAYRFDDPEGEVGIETLLARVGTDTLLQIPLTYRGAPLVGAEAWLIGTMQHGVLGDRWAYDATGDPAYLAALATVVLSGGTHAEQFYEEDGRRVPRELNAFVRGTGTDARAGVSAEMLPPVATHHESGTTIATAGGLQLTVVRVLEPARSDSEWPELVADGGASRLMGTWIGQPDPTTLAAVVTRSTA